MEVKDSCRKRQRNAFTLIELTVVISVLVAIAIIAVSINNPIGDWQQAQDASNTLRDVEVAQREFLANNPLKAVSSLTVAEVAAFLPDNPGTLPTVNDLDGNPLTINITVSPPVFESGSATYDPSGSATDGLWDVGR